MTQKVIGIRKPYGEKSLSSTKRLDTIWQKLIVGQLTSHELPKKVDLFDILKDIDRLWQLTAKDRKERVACILINPNGMLRLDHEEVGKIPEGYSRGIH